MTTPIALTPVRSTRISWVNILIAVLCAGVAVVLLVEQDWVRVIEAELTRYVIGAVTIGKVNSAGSVIWFGLGTHDVVGLSITSLCSSVLLMAPLLLLGCAILAIPGFRSPGVLIGLGVALALAVGANIVRFAMAAAAYQSYGIGGFDFVHRYTGSLLVIIAFVLAFLLLVAIAIRSSRTKPVVRRNTFQPVRRGEQRGTKA